MIVVSGLLVIGIGGFTIARRTLDTVGEGLTDPPILAAMIVSLIDATIITVLSDLGLPASLAVTKTSVPDMSTNALLAESASSESADVPGRGPTIGELATEQPHGTGETDPTTVPKIGEETPEELLNETPVMFDRVATDQVVFLWLLTPTLSTIGSYIVFVLLL